MPKAGKVGETFENRGFNPKMEESFFDLPLDRELYEPKKFIKKPKPPLRILITDAGGKIAYNVIYEICSGNTFGEDQEIIIHLINSRGSLHHKAIVLELQQCGFSACIEFVLSSNPEVAFKNVDIVIAIATYEEIPGRSIGNSLVYQMVKARQMGWYVQQYSSKDAKVIFVGPSTKAITILLGAFQKFASKIPPTNITCVTNLDAVISKGLLAAKLKTTTDKIKNVIIWAITFPDVRNATVRMYPPGDIGNWEMKDIPISEALQDDQWLFTTFPMAIYRRVMTPDLLKYGKAVAQSLSQHLQYLFIGSDKFDEIVSMGVISPRTKAYGVPPDHGFSFPVTTQNGKWKILPNVSYDTATHLNLLRSIFYVTHSVMMNSIMRVVSYMLDYEATKNKMIDLHKRHFIDEIIETRKWITRYFVTTVRSEGVEKVTRAKLRGSKKSIAWNDDSEMTKKKLSKSKSSIRFSSGKLLGSKKGSEIARHKKGSFYSSHAYDLDSILGALSDKSMEDV